MTQEGETSDGDSVQSKIEETEEKMKLDFDLNSSTKEKEEVSLLTGALFSRWINFQSSLENIHTELSREERKVKQEAHINPKPPLNLSCPPSPEKPPDSGQPVTIVPRRAPPPRPPDLHGLVDGEVYAKSSVKKRGKVQRSLGGPPLKSSEPPYSGCNSDHECGFVAEGEKVLEKAGAKNEIGELCITLHLMGHMHKYLPSILHSNNLVHVSSSGQHTISLLSHVSLNDNEHSLPAKCHADTMQCELGQCYNKKGQTQVNFSLVFKTLTITMWAGMELFDPVLVNMVLLVKDKKALDRLSQYRLTLGLVQGREVTAIVQKVLSPFPALNSYLVFPFHASSCLHIFSSTSLGCLYIKENVGVSLNDLSIIIELWGELYEVAATRSNELMLNCKIVMLTNLNRKTEVTSLKSAFQIEVVAMEDVVNSVVMLLRIAEESAFDLLFRLDVLIETLGTTLTEMYMKHGLVCCAHVLFVGKALRGIYGNNEDYALTLGMISLYSWDFPRQWDPGKNNIFMGVAEYEHDWRNPLSIYGLLNLVYDRGKIWFKSIWVLLMLVYDRGKFCKAHGCN